MEMPNTTVAVSVECRLQMNRIAEIKSWTMGIIVQRAVQRLIETDDELAELREPMAKKR